MNGLPAVRVTDILVGRALPFGPNGEPSAIAKQCVARRLRLGISGFEGDEQGDRRHHGGPDKAVHHYPAEHYAAWRRECPELAPELFAVGAFGENLSTVGVAESQVCVGDVFRLGSARIEVSQARQPCWKLDRRFHLPAMAVWVQDSGRTGWYYRVRETGEVAPGDALELLERPHPDWPITRLLHYLYADPLNREALAAMATLAVLPGSWRQLARLRLESGRVEDWSRRLAVPEAVRKDGQ
jgi:MOSC domain-containing protein YiiM